MDRNPGQREPSGVLFDRFSHRLFERRTVSVTRLRQIFLYQMSDDFGVSLGREDVAFLDEFFLQAEVVLDDTVVDHNNRAGAVPMRMRIFFGGAAMGGPASMANAVGAVERLQADDFFQIA